MIDPAVTQSHLDRAARKFAVLVETADLRASVPSCPGWTVADLVHHVGRVHTWAARRLGPVVDAPPPAPEADAAAVAAWYRVCASGLSAALRTTDPAAVVSTFEEPGPASFWSRRQAHETAVHLWDLGTALFPDIGQDIGYDDELAVDGIDEVVTMFFPRQVRLGRTPPLDSALALSPYGQPRSWVLAGDGTAVVQNASVGVSGPAGVLLLAVWGRVGLDDPRLRVRGDLGTAARVLASGIVP